MEFDPWAKAGLGLLRRLASLRQPAEGRNTRCGLKSVASADDVVAKPVRNIGVATALAYKLIQFVGGMYA